MWISAQVDKGRRVIAATVWRCRLDRRFGRRIFFFFFAISFLFFKFGVVLVSVSVFYVCILYLRVTV